LVYGWWKFPTNSLHCSFFLNLNPWRAVHCTVCVQTSGRCPELSLRMACPLCLGNETLAAMGHRVIHSRGPGQGSSGNTVDWGGCLTQTFHKHVQWGKKSI
jgi:hypothetical protein